MLESDKSIVSIKYLSWKHFKTEYDSFTNLLYEELQKLKKSESSRYQLERGISAQNACESSRRASVNAAEIQS